MRTAGSARRLKIELHKEVTVMPLDSRVEKLEEQCANIQQVKLLVAKHSALLKCVDERAITKALDTLEARVTQLSSRLQVEITKTVVLSEVSRSFPQVWPLLIAALDRDNAWWTAGSQLTIEGWASRLTAAE